MRSILDEYRCSSHAAYRFVSRFEKNPDFPEERPKKQQTRSGKLHRTRVDSELRKLEPLLVTYNRFQGNLIIFGIRNKTVPIKLVADPKTKKVCTIVNPSNRKIWFDRTLKTKRGEIRKFRITILLDCYFTTGDIKYCTKVEREYGPDTFKTYRVYPYIKSTIDELWSEIIVEEDI